MKLNFTNKNKTKLSYTFLRIMIKVSELDKKSRYYGTDQPLHEAEIHMIKSIKENEGIHVTGLAEMLGVTKGAVSQILMKLQRKGMIVKETDPKNLSRLVLRLSDQGEVAYKSHEKLHEEYEQLFHDILKDNSEEEKNVIKEFFHSLESKIDVFQDEYEDKKE